MDDAKDIIVRGCGNCPFKHTSVDFDKVGNDTLEICDLAMYQNNLDIIIASYDYGDKIKLRTPRWCPLKKQSFNIKFLQKW